MKTKEKLIEEIVRMMDEYEIYTLSEESGLQEQFEKDIIKIFEKGIEEGKQEAIEDEIKFLEQPHIKGNSVDIKKRISELKEQEK